MATGNSSADGKKKTERMVFSSADDVETIVEMDAAGKSVDFDIEAFPELPDDVVRGFHHETKERYFVARTLNRQFREGEKRSAKSKEIGERIELLGSMDMTAKSKFDRAKPLAEKGMHLAFKDPDEIEFAKEQGYKPVKDKDGTYTIKGKKGEDELVAMQIPDERYQKHMDGVSKLSRRGLKSHFEKTADEAKTVVRGPERTIIKNWGKNDWNE